MENIYEAASGLRDNPALTDELMNNLDKVALGIEGNMKEWWKFPRADIKKDWKGMLRNYLSDPVFVLTCITQNINLPDRNDERGLGRRFYILWGPRKNSAFLDGLGCWLLKLALRYKGHPFNTLIDKSIKGVSAMLRGDKALVNCYINYWLAMRLKALGLVSPSGRSEEKAIEPTEEESAFTTDFDLLLSKVAAVLYCDTAGANPSKIKHIKTSKASKVAVEAAVVTSLTVAAVQATFEGKAGAATFGFDSEFDGFLLKWDSDQEY